LAGIGRGQLEVIEDRVKQRRSNFDFYSHKLNSIPGVSFMPEIEPGFSNRWLTTILVDPSESGNISREVIRKELEKSNIETRPLWKPMHLQPVFENCPNYVDGSSEKLFELGLCLPSGSNLTGDDLNRVVNNINEVFHVAN
jgi:dTDP-4-amino-4,6-dideoxygalactose transaminase